MKILTMTQFKIVTSIVFCAMAGAANAAIVVPEEGASYTFTWTDMSGDIADIGGSFETDWTLLATTNGMYTISVEDQYIPGDEFGLLINGDETDWDEWGISSSGHFFGSYSFETFASMTYNFGLKVIAFADGYSSGEASLSVVPSVPLPAVPVPAAGFLLVGGIAALGALKRRRQN